jgi:hypothetical protein
VYFGGGNVFAFPLLLKGILPQWRFRPESSGEAPQRPPETFVEITRYRVVKMSLYLS